MCCLGQKTARLYTNRNLCCLGQTKLKCIDYRPQATLSQSISKASPFNNSTPKHTTNSPQELDEPDEPVSELILDQQDGQRTDKSYQRQDAELQQVTWKQLKH